MLCNVCIRELTNSSHLLSMETVLLFVHDKDKRTPTTQEVEVEKTNKQNKTSCYSISKSRLLIQRFSIWLKATLCLLSGNFFPCCSTASCDLRGGATRGSNPLLLQLVDVICFLLFHVEETLVNTRNVPNFTLSHHVSSTHSQHQIQM